MMVTFSRILQLRRLTSPLMPVFSSLSAFIQLVKGKAHYFLDCGSLANMYPDADLLKRNVTKLHSPGILFAFISHILTMSATDSIMALCLRCRSKQQKESNPAPGYCHPRIDDDMPLDGLFIAHRKRAFQRTGASSPCSNCNKLRREGDFALEPLVEPSSTSSGKKATNPSQRPPVMSSFIGKYHPQKWPLASAADCDRVGLEHVQR